MRKAFTLVEMLVVIAIIGILTSVGLMAYGPAIGSSEKARCQELVDNTRDALSQLFRDKGRWPQALLSGAGATGGQLDEKAAYPLAKGGYLPLTYDAGSKKLTGYNKFGVISPWAETTLKSRGSSASLGDRVPGGGTIKDHILWYALDMDGDGIIEGASVGGESINVRGDVIVWCCGKDGKLEAYSKGLRKDDVYSWAPGHAENVK